MKKISITFGGGQAECLLNCFLFRYSAVKMVNSKNGVLYYYISIKYILYAVNMYGSGTRYNQ